MALTVPVDQRRAIGRISARSGLIAHNASGGTVKTSPPAVGGQIKKESAMPTNTTMSSTNPDCRGVLLRNPLRARQLIDALSVLANWEVK
jgi:NifB/MoaA-like Fe-S oxidoreductase